MSTLITGGAGFIGSNLAEFFIQNNNENILIMDNFNDYYSSEIKRKNIQEILRKDIHNKITLCEGDIRNKNFINEIFENYNISKVFHLAAIPGVRNSIKKPNLYLSVNLGGTINILEAMKYHNVNSLIFASSSSVYGNIKKIPFSENFNLGKPISPYAATKLSGEQFCYIYHHLYGMHITCLRFFTVYGPRGRPDMAAYKFMDKIYNNNTIFRYGKGDSKRDYTYIADIIQGIVLASKNDYPFEIFNLGKGEITNLNDFIKTLEQIMEKDAVIEERPKQSGDMEITYADIKKAGQKLGYKPKYSIKEGLTKMYRWYVENRI